jgi:hypothetical protein
LADLACRGEVAPRRDEDGRLGGSIVLPAAHRGKRRTAVTGSTPADKLLQQNDKMINFSIDTLFCLLYQTFSFDPKEDTR